jgi:Bacterial Ig-like domain (group 3)/FG-GAP-like repeat
MSQKNRILCSVTSLLFTSVAIAAADLGRFLAPATYPTGQLPVAAVTGDLNHDGLIDLATANQNDDNISILLGQGGGAFGDATEYPGGSDPFGIAAGDLNDDGEIDLVVSNSTGDSVSIFLGNGDGSFGGATSLAIPSSPRGIVLADLDEDGNLDLAVAAHGLAQTGQGWIAVSLGQGNGSFQNPILYPAGQNPLRLVAEDLNADGILDLAVADENLTGSPNDVAILLGNGDGTFPAPLLSHTTGTSADVTTFDLNGDGRLDLVIAGGEGRVVSLRFGNGDGTFQNPTNQQTPSIARTITVALLDGDNLPDLLVGGSDGVNVLLGQGNGSFQAPTTFGIGTLFAIADDFDQDGALDAVATGDLFSVSVAFGNGDGTFDAARVYSGGTTIEALTAGDFNRDSRLDLALGKQPTDTISILLGSGTGAFAQGALFGAVEPSDLLAADFNRDKRLDLAVASKAALTSGAHIYLGNGDGTFGAPLDLIPGVDPLSEVAADFNHDGRLDLATSNADTEEVSVLLGNGDGTFQPAVNYPAQRNPNVILTEDFNRDGKLDLAVNNSSSARVGIYLGNGDGTFQNPIDLIVVATTMVSGDFNRDRNPDLILGGNPRLFLGNGDGTFQAGQFISFANGEMQTADLNGDGRLDLLVASAQLEVMLGNGNGTFQPGVNYFPGALTLGELEVADLNGDAAPDVLVTDRLENVSAMLNTGGVQLSLTSSLNPSQEGEAVTFTIMIAPTFPEAGELSGRVTFKDGPVVLGNGRVRQGRARFSTSELSAGEHSISAIYSGNDVFNRRTSPALSQTVLAP